MLQIFNFMSDMHINPFSIVVYHIIFLTESKLNIIPLEIKSETTLTMINFILLLKNI